MIETQLSYYSKHKFKPINYTINSNKNLKILTAQRDNLYKKLYLHDFIWRNSNVLEIGTECGENTLVIANKGALLDVVEPNKEFIDSLLKLFKHWKLLSSIKKIYNETLEEFIPEKKYDIIVAEGFLFSLKTRKKQIRKLFKALSKNGLLIINTLDTYGSCIETSKSYFFKRYLKENDIPIDDITRCISESKQFFYDDYKSLPTLRPYENWVLDVILNPVNNCNSLWGFDEIVKDLNGLHPIYYSSHPSYLTGIDYDWYKIIKKDDINEVVDSYLKKRIQFVVGKWGIPNHYIVFKKE